MFSMVLGDLGGSSHVVNVSAAVLGGKEALPGTSSCSAPGVFSQWFDKNGPTRRTRIMWEMPRPNTKFNMFDQSSSWELPETCSQFFSIGWRREGFSSRAMRVPMKPKDRMLVTSSERYHAMSISPFAASNAPFCLSINHFLVLNNPKTIPKLLVLNPRIPQRSAKTNKALCRVIHRHQPSLGAY